MEIDSLTEKIDNIIETIFECNFNIVVQNTLKIVEYIDQNIVFSNEENRETWKQIIYYLTIGLENKDYLAVGDILKYELKPMLEEENLL
ncbi:MAG: hypothetical protein GYA02_08175 [Clostridiaceae bacterium]|nr:hypothetical protein [Clostridiaceae bacterium]